MIASLALVLAAPVLKQKNSLVASSIEAKHEVVDPCAGKKLGDLRTLEDRPELGYVDGLRGLSLA